MKRCLLVLGGGKASQEALATSPKKPESLLAGTRGPSSFPGVRANHLNRPFCQNSLDALNPGFLKKSGKQKGFFGGNFILNVRYKKNNLTENFLSNERYK